MKLIEPFGDEKAWRVQEKLVECYFKVKEEQRVASLEPPPGTDMDDYALMLAQRNYDYAHKNAAQQKKRTHSFFD